jgi:hypothetical protein
MPPVSSYELKGVRDKLDWAQHHFHDVDAAIQRLGLPEAERKSKPTVNFDTQAKELVIRLGERPPLDPSVALMVGDCIHNVRSAFDHLAYQLALKHSPSRVAEWENRIQFPIYLDEKRFNSFVDKKVAPFISATALAEIKQLQPYWPGNDGADDIIWAISQLDVIDKHRLLVIAVEKFRPVELIDTGNVPISFVDFAESDWKTAEDGAEVLRIKVPSLGEVAGKMHMNIKTAHSVHFKGTGLSCDKFAVLQVLNECISFAGYVVDDFGKKFFGE